MTNDQLVEKLQRMRAYNSGPLTHDDREVLQAAVDAVRTSDDVLAEALPNLGTLADLLTVLVNPKKYQDALAKITEQVKAATEQRKAAAAEREALESSHTTLKPKLDAEKSAHERSLADAQDAFDKRVADYQKQLAVRSDALRVLEERVRADAAEAARLKEEFQTKLAAIRSAAA
jgi:chromosome segregation ATPase